jgi:hypothetical protein
MAQKTFSLGESRSCSVVACGCAAPHIRTLLSTVIHLHHCVLLNLRAIVVLVFV